MRCLDVPIDRGVVETSRMLDAAFGSIGAKRLGETLPDLTEENLQSRLRGLVVMGVSNRTGAIVLTTGNKSELAVGYCTLYGDMNGGLAVLSDVPKTMVYRLAREMNERWEDLGFAREPIPERSISKPPSAELRPDQTDQDSLPAYEVLDQIVERYVERRQSGRGIVEATGIDAATVARVIRMIDLAEYKRKQLAIGLKVTGVAFGQGRRMPIAQRWRERM
jgi:NAD+ synthetase